MTTGIPFVITQAMKAALRARKFSNAKIANLKPEQAHEILAKPDAHEVCKFIEIIVAQARAATKHLKDPGVLQTILVHPRDDDVSGVYRYTLDDHELIERMTREAVSASESGHNVYIEGRTVRRGLRGKQRGEFTDTVAVYAIVVDNDADKNLAWTPTVPVSLIVESSPNNAHDWIFFRPALDPGTAQAFGERLRTATNTDHDTGNVCQPYRIAGTTNYPNEKKRERGRITTWTRILDHAPKTLWTPEQFNKKFHTNGKGNISSDGTDTVITNADTSVAGLFEQAGREIKLEAPIADIKETLARIPRTEKDKHATDYWKTIGHKPDRKYLIYIGHAVYGASGGSVEGREAFKEWRKGAPGFSDRMVNKKWKKFRSKKIGFGTLKHFADTANPEEESPLWEPQQGNSQAAQAQNAAQAAQQGVSQQTSTIEPIDLWGRFAAPTLPLGLLPKKIEEFAFAQADILGADVGGIAVAALVICAAVISDDIKLKVKQHSRGWMEEARLWATLVGMPSSKKSPILRTVASPLIRIDSQLWRTYIEQKIAYEQLSAEDRKAKEPPIQHRLRVGDTSIESAQGVLKDNPDGVLCLQDELGGWFGSMDKYGGGRGATHDRAFWLQAWNGGSYAVNRVSRGSFLIENLSISLIGGIQPDLIRKFVSDAHDDGLIQRLLPIVLNGAKTSKDIPSNVEDYNELITELHQLRRIAELEFDAGAQKIQQQLETKHLDLSQLEGINKKLAAHVAKYDAYFPRLCIVWHCIEHYADKHFPHAVSEHTAQRVAKFMHEFLFPHAIAFYAGVLDLSDDHDRLSAVAGHILAHKLTQVTNRDVQRGDRSMRGLTRYDTERIFEQLEAFGWLGRKPAKRPSDPPHWLVNPRCHELFAERAKLEGERRARLRQLVAERVS